MRLISKALSLLVLLMSFSVGAQTSNCSDIINFQISRVNATSVELTWNILSSPNPPVDLQIFETTDPNELPPTGANANMNLALNVIRPIDYDVRKYFYLRTICGNVTNWVGGDWVGPVSVDAVPDPGLQVRDDLWGIFGSNSTEVRAIAQYGDTLIFGGESLNYCGPKNEYLSIYDTASGELLEGVAKPNDRVRIVVEDGQGGWFIGGDFTEIDGVPRNKMARINSDGSLHPWDVSIGPTNGASSYINVMELYQGVLYAAGGGSGLLSYDVNTGQQLNALPTGGNILDIECADSTCFIGGFFDNVDGDYSISNLFGLDLSNDSVFGIPSGSVNTVYDIDLSAQYIYLSGNFSHINSGQNVARVSYNNLEIDSVWGISTSSSFTNEIIIVEDSIILVKRGFTTGWLLEFDLETGTQLYDHGWTLAFNYYQGKLLHSNGSSFQVLDFSTRTSESIIEYMGSGSESNLTEMIPGNSTWCLAGGFQSIGGYSENNMIVLIDRLTGKGIPSDLAVSLYHINSMAVSEGVLYIGGRLSSGVQDANGYTSRNHLAAIDLKTLTVLPFDAGIPNRYFDEVNDLSISGDTLFVAGNFSQIGGANVNNLAAIDKNSAAAFSWNPNPNGIVYRLETFGNELFALGDFDLVGSTATSNLVSIDRRTGQLNSWSPEVNIPFNHFELTMKRLDSLLFVSHGQLDSASGQELDHQLAVFDLNNKNLVDNEVSFRMSNNTSIHSYRDFGLFGRTIIGGGHFNSGFHSEALGFFDWQTQTRLTGMPELDISHPYDKGLENLLIVDNEIYLAGSFQGLGESIACIYVESGPTVELKNIEQISSSSARIVSKVVATNGSDITERGLCWSTSPNPSLTDSSQSSGSGLGAYSININGLMIGTNYYFRAYAINGTDTSYSEEEMFSITDDCGWSEGSSGDIQQSGSVVWDENTSKIDSVSAVNANKGVYRAWFSSLVGDQFRLEFKEVNDTIWRTKNIANPNQTSQKFNITPSYGTSVEVRLAVHQNGVWTYGCEGDVVIPCKNQILNMVVQNSAFCADDSVLVRAGYAGGQGVPSFLWSNGATTKRTYADQGETLTVTVTDAAGCSVSDDITAPVLDAATAPTNFTLSKLNATTFRGSWNSASLGAGESLIGYRMAYRLRNTQNWTNVPLTTDTFSIIDFTGSGNAGGNYEFVAFTRYNNGSSNVNSVFSCRQVKGYNGSGNKAEASSMNTTQAAGISIYPNPAKDQLFIQAPNNSKVVLSDLQGKILGQLNVADAEVSFDMSSLAGGVYLVRVTTQANSFTEQIVKK